MESFRSVSFDNAAGHQLARMAGAPQRRNNSLRTYLPGEAVLRSIDQSYTDCAGAHGAGNRKCARGARGEGAGGT